MPQTAAAAVWRMAVLSTRWRAYSPIQRPDCRVCSVCLTRLEGIDATVWVEERGAILICVCPACLAMLTIISDRRVWEPVMPRLACPACTTLTPRRLDVWSRLASVNYYRCPACGHVWTVAKDDPTRIEHVTPLPDHR
jgi:hypothetical protein